MRKDSLTKKLAGTSPKAFWDEIKSVSNNTMSLPTNIEGVTGRNNIAELWRNHYKDLFITLVMSLVTSAYVMTFVLHQMRLNRPSTIWTVINRAAWMGLRLTALLIHGFLPERMLSVVLVPVIKDKNGKINSKDSYRPIALASIISKVFEHVLMNRLEEYLYTSDNQFGFKKKTRHGHVHLCT